MKSKSSQVLLSDPFKARGSLSARQGPVGIYRLTRLEELGLTQIHRLPFSMRVLLESALRKCDGFLVTENDVKALAAWSAEKLPQVEIPFLPARVVLQDFTGVPAVVDLAAMRAAMRRLGGDPRKINPLIPVDLVIDHSVQVDQFGSATALQANVDLEFQRNRERYEFLRWGQQAFDNFRAVPPNVGIVHQVNLEFLAKCVFVRNDSVGPVAFPDSLVGTDSHTTMINGLGVVGWGVGGIEAEAVMLGQPLYMLLPEVVGFELIGELVPGTTATDLVLTVTETLRKAGVVNKFVEFHGSGIATMSLADRATIANMAPEYGATMGFFPIDAESLNYLRRTGRTTDEVDLVERYTEEQGLFRDEQTLTPDFTTHLQLDLSTVEPSLAGPKRPQDRIPLRRVQDVLRKSLKAPLNERGYALPESELARTSVVRNGRNASIGHGAVVIAAITSCTNTSNPSVMIAAGLLAKKAAARGMKVPAFVKTSLAPGSRVVTDYLDRAGLTESLNALGFHTVGYGCTTCIGNSGPLPDPVAKAVTDGKIVAAAVLSGNRNFEGRVNPLVQANFLASPPLVVAFALAGTTDINMATSPIGRDDEGREVWLKEIWPTSEEIKQAIQDHIRPEMFTALYDSALTGNAQWNSIKTSTGDLYDWEATSTYIQHPPFLTEIGRETGTINGITGARVLCALGDSVTTDHISPAGSIAKDSPAAKYLVANGVEPRDFNSYGARRGNDKVMVRGTFANIRIRNQLVNGVEGGMTRYLPSGEILPIFDAAEKYKQTGTPLVVLAGTEYGTGSSRDWAAKGTMLLGVKAVLAASYERIHRSNLVGMGVLPLQFPEGSTWQSLGLTGEETIEIGMSESIPPRGTVEVVARAPSGETKRFTATVRIDTPVEMDYYRHGGILPAVLRKLLDESDVVA